MGDQKRYRAFISYSQKDKRAARRLHRWLETYRIPAGVTAVSNRRLGRFFRDDEEMGAAADIGAAVRGALEDSESLIVLCTPRSATSRWVAAEIEHFRRTGRGNKVFAVIMDGVANADDPAQECFPPPLRTAGKSDDPAAMPIEPLGLDVRKEGHGRALARLAAGLLGVDFDTLWRRDRRRVLSRALQTSAALTALVLAASWGGYFALSRAAEAARRASDALARESQAMKESGLYDQALLMALQADPAAQRSVIARLFDGASGYSSARARAVAAGASMRVTQVLRGDYTKLATFSPDGKRIIALSILGEEQEWDARTGIRLPAGKQVGGIGSGKGTFLLAISPGGARFAAYDGDSDRAYVADSHTGSVLALLDGHGGEVRRAAFSSDGSRVVTTSADMPRVWDAKTGRLVQALKGQQDAAALSAGGELVVTDLHNRIAVWDAVTGRLLQTLNRGVSLSISAAFSPDGSQLVIAEDMRDESTMRIYRIDHRPFESVQVKFELEQTLTRHGYSIRSVAFSPDGNRIITASDDNTARIWDILSGNLLLALAGHNGVLDTAVFSPDGNSVLTLSADSTIRVWDVRTRSPAFVSPVEVLAKLAVFSPDGGRVATVGPNDVINEIEVWDVRTGQLLQSLEGQGQMLGIAFSADGKRIAAALADRTTLMWDARTGRLLGAAAGHDAVRFAAFSPDVDRLVTSAQYNTARLWDAKSGRLLQTFKGPFKADGEAVLSAAVSASGRQVATGSNDKAVRLWDAQTGHLLQTLDAHDINVGLVAFSPDSGRILASAWGDGTARLWDARNGNLLSTLQPFALALGDITFAAFSPDGRLVITGYENDETASIWDVQSGALLLSINDGPFLNAAFSPSGTRILTASKSRTKVSVWDVPAILLAPPKELVRVACEKLWHAHAPLAFTREDAQRYPLLQGQPTDPRTGDLVSPCRGILPPEAFPNRDPANTARAGT